MSEEQAKYRWLDNLKTRKAKQKNKDDEQGKNPNK